MPVSTQIPLINGVNYSWANIVVVLFDIPVIGITKISYKRKETKVNNYGIGQEPISRGYGNIEYEAEIEIYADELRRIIASAPNQDILAIPPFKVQVIFENTLGLLAQDTLLNCEFTEDSIASTQNDQKILVTIPLIICGITHKKL
jgi:hypothetical protein